MKFSRAINENGLLYVAYAEVKQQEEELKEELKVYKKALGLASEYLWDNSICDCCPKQADRDKCGCEQCDVVSKDYESFILQKARE